MNKLYETPLENEENEVYAQRRNSKKYFRRAHVMYASELMCRSARLPPAPCSSNTYLLNSFQPLLISDLLRPANPFSQILNHLLHSIGVHRC